MMRKEVMLVGLLLAVLVACTGAKKIGVKATLSYAGLYYMEQIGIELLEDDLSQLSVPDITGKADTPIGHVTYELTDIVVQKVSISSSNVSLVPSSTVDISATDMAVTMTLNWRYREDGWPHVSDSGSADISMSDTTLAAGVAIGESGGRATAKAADCTVSIGNLDITLHGGASWLYNIFINLFAGQIKSSTQSSLQSAIVDSINKGLDTTLTSLPVSQPINHNMYLDYRLEEAPTVTPSYFTLDSLGEFYSTSAPKESPTSPVSMPDHVENVMAQVFVSEFTVNSAFYAAFEDKLLHYTITDDMLPKTAPLRLNTTYFTELIPPLETAYPNQMFELYIYATKGPVASFSDKGATVSAYGGIDILILPHKQLAFTLGVEVLCKGDANVKSQNVTGDLTFLNATIWLANSTVGNFDTTPLQSIVDLLVTEALIPMANKMLGAGFPLPTVAGLTFIRPKVGWMDQYIYIATDLHFVPPSVKAKQMQIIAKENAKIVVV